MVDENIALNSSFLGGRSSAQPTRQRQTAISDLVTKIERTSTVQRLRRMRQMELAHHAFPLAEHSRLVHSLGTAHWAKVMYKGLISKRNPSAKGNSYALKKMQSMLGADFHLQRMIELYALLHDVGTYPLGHTLARFNHFQREEQFTKSLSFSLSKIASEIEADQDAVRYPRSFLKRSIAWVEAFAHADHFLRGGEPKPFMFLRGVLSTEEISNCLPVISFAHDLVHGVFAADLLDWGIRDSVAMGLKAPDPTAIVHSGEIVYSSAVGHSANSSGYRDLADVFKIGFRCNSKESGDATVLSDLVEFHRLRRKIILEGVYSKTKRAADALLDKAIRQAFSHEETNNTSPQFHEMMLRFGDEEFFDIIRLKSSAYGEASAASLLRRDTLYECVYSEDAVESAVSFDSLFRLQTQSSHRDSTESTISELTAVDVNSIVVSCTPKSMQFKPANTLIQMHGIGWLELSELCNYTDQFEDLQNLEREYQNAMKLEVFLNPKNGSSKTDVSNAAGEVFSALQSKRKQ